MLKFLKAAHHCKKASVSVEDARNLFNPAITEFVRSGRVHFAAIANEVAGKVMIQKKEVFWAEHYLKEACQRWFDYDATVKAEQMLGKYQVLKRDEIHAKKRSSDIQGRSRYDSSTDSVVNRYRAREGLPASMQVANQMPDAPEESPSQFYLSN